MNHDAVEQSMFWVGAMFVFTPVIFAGIVLGVWWHKRKQERNASEGSGPPAPGQR
jgi:hypothetical protein